MRALRETTMLKRIAYALTGLVASALIAVGAVIPNLPSTSQYSEPSQIIATINTLIQQLNGQAGYAPAQLIGLGSYGTGSAASPGPVVIPAQRGIATFTSVGTLVTGAVVTLTITDTLVAANSACSAQVISGGAAGSAPYVSTVTPTAGSLALILANGGTTATGAAQTFNIGFNCYNYGGGITCN